MAAIWTTKVIWILKAWDFRDRAYGAAVTLPHAANLLKARSA
jgi:hypothetical protein